MTPKHDGTLTAEIARLDSLGLGELRDLWRQRLGSPPRFASTEMTRLWLAWELQARASGGYDPATRRRLRQVGKSSGVDAAPTSTSPRALKPGTVLVQATQEGASGMIAIQVAFSSAD